MIYRKICFINTLKNVKKCCLNMLFLKVKQHFVRLQKPYTAKNVQSCGSWQSVFSFVTESRKNTQEINKIINRPCSIYRNFYLTSDINWPTSIFGLVLFVPHVVRHGTEFILF